MKISRPMERSAVAAELRIDSDGFFEQRMDGGDSMAGYGGPDSRFCSATMGGECTFLEGTRTCARCGVNKNEGADDGEQAVAVEQQIESDGFVQQQVDDGPGFMEQRIEREPQQQQQQQQLLLTARLSRGPAQVMQRLNAGGYSMAGYGGVDSPFCGATKGGECTFAAGTRTCMRCGVTKNAGGAQQAVTIVVEQQMDGGMAGYGGANSPFCSATMGGECTFEEGSRTCTRCGVAKK
jgi:hypothetical protein